MAESALAAPQAGFAGAEAYPDFATKAAVLCWHLVKNHPLPDGNKRCAFLATVEFVERNGRRWVPAPGDPDETDQVIRAAASGEGAKVPFATGSPPGAGEIYDSAVAPGVDDRRAALAAWVPLGPSQGCEELSGR
jgi:hypothetical protein